MYIIISNHYNRVLAIYELLSFSRSSIKMYVCFCEKKLYGGMTK